MSSHKQDELWCHDCGKSVPGICKKHGGFTQVFDNAIPSRARLTCPAGLVIKQVKTEDGKTSYGIFAKRIIQCRSQFGPLYGQVKSTEKHTPKKETTDVSGDEKPAKETIEEGAPSVQLIEPEINNQIPQNIPQNSQQQEADIQRQLSIEPQQQQQHINSSEMIPHNDDGHLLLQNIDGFDTANMQQQLVSQQYSQQNNNTFTLQHPNIDKATQIMNIQNCLHAGPYGDAGLQHLAGGYTPQQALDIVTTLSGDTAASQFEQPQLSQDLTLQASIEAGITPADSYVSEGLTETQLLEHQIAVATQELQNMTSDQQPLPPSSMSLSSLENTTLPSTDHMQHNTTESLQQNAVLASTEPLPTELTSESEQQPQNSADQPLATEVTEQTGEKEKETEKKELDYTYEIKIFKDDGFVDNIDISDEDKSNWMMFVRPARNTAEQNVVVYQQDEHIFFVSIKPIPSNTEIKVWYSAEYAEMMDKPLLPDPEPIITETPDQEATGVAAKWVCSVCYDGFSAFADLEAHLCPGLPPDSRRLRGRPRKGRPRKYIKPSKTWRARLEKSRMLKAKVVDPSQSQPLPPRRRGRPPKNKRPALDIPPPLQVEETPDDQVLDGEPEDKVYMEQVMDDDEDEEKTTTEMLDEILGADEDYPEPMPRRRGRKKGRIPRGPRASRREPMQCPHCTETFTKEALFVIHVSDHTGVKPFICEVAECSKGFMSKFKLERHRLIHTCPRHHKCPYCDKSFNRKDHLKNHMITHDPNKKRWVCEECGKEYSYNFSYRTHKAFHDADAGRSTECGICHKQHETREELLYHLKVHSGARSVKNCTEKIHACPECGKKFYTRKDVRRHMITHTKKKDFLCQYCPQRFGRKDHLTRHLRSSHSGDNANKPPRAPRGERKEKLKEYEKVSAAVFQALNIPREDPTVLVTSQPNINSIYHTMQTADGRELAVPIQLYENNAHKVQTHGTMYLTNQQQPAQQQIINKDVNLDMIRTNGVLPAEYQVNRDQTNRPTVVQTNDNRQQSQTFSTLLGYMETLRFLENLPTTAQGGVIAQIEGGPPTMQNVSQFLKPSVTAQSPVLNHWLCRKCYGFVS
ncbi:zinc finger protein PLAG1, partial [Mytilus galloprovincialis]